jgi:protein-disulfide isomerase
MRRYSIGSTGLDFRFALAFLLMVSIGGGATFCAGARAESSADPEVVFAVVDNHKITEQEVDSTIRVPLYNLRQEAMDDAIANYLIEQAAKSENMTIAAYLKSEVDDKAAAKVTDATARKFYDDNKSKLLVLKNTPYDKIKGRLIEVLRQQDSKAELVDLVTNLRKKANLKILLEPPRLEVATGDGQSLGPQNAPVTIVEFADFQCPYCKRAEETLKAVQEKYGTKVRLVFMDYPLSFHAHAMDAANAGRCAAEQGKFWHYRDALFADQSKLGRDELKATAKRLGLNSEQFSACLDENKYESVIKLSIAEGNTLNVRGTPTFFVDGRPLSGSARLDEAITEELASPDNLKTIVSKRQTGVSPQ